MGERDDFDRIVEGLDLDIDLTFPDEPADPVPEPALTAPEPVDPADAEPVETEEPFYRVVEPTTLVPRRRGPLLAWCGVLGIPLALGLAALADVFIARPLMAGAALTFVASAIYLFLQLPEHGPSRPDWPDDGAVL